MRDALHETGWLAYMSDSIIHRVWLCFALFWLYYDLSWNNLCFINSLAPRRFNFNFRKVIFKLILVNGCWGISYEIALGWMAQDIADDKSTLVQEMAWCHQPTSHYLSQCWPRSLSPYGVTRPQWVDPCSSGLTPWLLNLPQSPHCWAGADDHAKKFSMLQTWSYCTYQATQTPLFLTPSMLLRCTTYVKFAQDVISYGK